MGVIGVNAIFIGLPTSIGDHESLPVCTVLVLVL